MLKDYIGEATAYDKKLMLERKEPTSWLKSVSAFANTQGGKLLFGVADDGSLVGLADAQDDSEFISETIKMQMDPVPEINLSIHEEDGRQFVVVEIKAGSETPYYTFVRGHRDAYIRIGKILRAYDLESQKRGRDFKVLFSSIHMGFTLVLPNLNYGQTIEGLVGEVSADSSDKAVGNVDCDVYRNVVRILDVVKGNPHITQKEIASCLNLSLRGVEDMIKRAREKDLIRRVGGKRFGHWEVVKRCGNGGARRPAEPQTKGP